MYITIPFTHHALSPAVALSGNRVRSGIGCVPGIVYLSHPSISTVSLIYLTPLPYLHCIQIIYILHPLIQTYIDYISIHTSNHSYIHSYIHQYIYLTIHTPFTPSISHSSVFLYISPPGQNLRSVKITSNSPLHTLTQIYIYSYTHQTLTHSYTHTDIYSFIHSVLHILLPHVRAVVIPLRGCGPFQVPMPLLGITSALINYVVYIFIVY